MMTAKFVEWPCAGPEKWLLGWHKLMADCKKWSPALYTDWVSDFNLVWGEVSGAARLCERLAEAETSGNLGDWNIYKASSELQKAWDQRLIRSGMRIVWQRYYFVKKFDLNVTNKWVTRTFGYTVD